MTIRSLRRAALAALLVLPALTFGCVRAHVSAGRSVSRSELAAQLMDADRRFNDDVAREGLAAWVRWFAPDGAQLVPGAVVRGPDAIRELMSSLLTDPTRRLTWAPDTAFVSASGDLGYTLGHSRTERRNADGTTSVVQTGRYVTLWRRQPDGSWKVELDTGHPDPRP